jgi:hypothetical protein
MSLPCWVLKGKGARSAFLLFVYRGYVGVGDWLYLLQPAQLPIDLIRIERLGVETVPNPFQVFLMLRMVGVVERLQQGLVSGYSANVFGRTGAGTHQANWITHTFLRGKNVFDEEFMLPKVTEIVLVGKAKVLLRHHVPQPVFAFIRCSPLANLGPVRYPVPLSPDKKLVEVCVRPAHDSLQNSVEFSERDVGSYLELTPDGWVRAAEADPELVNLNWSCSSFEHRGFSRAIIKDRG